MNWQQCLNIVSKIDWGIVIGVIALIFTAVSLYFQRKHNRLSVRPIAIISVGDYEDELGVYLENKGTGPLIIKNLSFTHTDGTKEKAIINFFSSGFDNLTWNTFVGNIDGWAILPNEKKTLIKFIGDPVDEDFVRVRENIRNILAQIQLELLYEDIYKKTMEKKIRKLDWFTR